jgi:indolepyruvate ferredoxin oxidoreductase, beta subunit
VSTICNLVLAGVGGQGVLSTARLLGQAAAEAGLEVRGAQLYGLSQRGGSVEATVRIGPVTTAFISPTEADVVLGLEPLETERALSRMSARTTVLVNQTPIVPFSLTLDRTTYPDLSTIVEGIATVAGIVHVIDGNALALQAGDLRLLNMVMLGALDGIGVLPIPSDVLESTVEHHGLGPDPGSRVEAFQIGQEFARETHAEASGGDNDPVHH